MKNLKILSPLLIILLFTNCKSLNQRKDSATKQLSRFQNGVLLVRLPTNEAKIAKLKEIGKSEKAKKENSYMKQFHVDILKSFDKAFNFCPVYFYYSDVSEAIRDGNIDGNIFDAKLKNISNLEPPMDHRFYAEFGYVHEKEAMVEKDGKMVKVAGFGGKSALVIRTKEGVQPLSPFPYTVDYNYRGENSLTASVEKLNRKLYTVTNRMERRTVRRKRKGKESNLSN